MADLNRPAPHRHVPRVMAVGLAAAFACLVGHHVRQPAPPAPGSPGSPGRPGESTGLDFRVRINEDDPATLRLLPSVGQRIARGIVIHREQVARFDHVEQLEAVPWVGPRTREQIEPWVSLEIAAPERP